jgi:uncharacterized protein (DUF433 family)
MTHEELLARVTVDAKVCTGKPSVDGIWVRPVQDLDSSIKICKISGLAVAFWP